MPVPDFILALRAKIGHDLLWLPAVTGAVFDDDGRVLLVRRADNGLWTLVTGYLDPGEHPAVGVVREIQEETGVKAEVRRLVSVDALPPEVCPNGDRVQCLDMAFRCEAVSSAAWVNDDESVDVGWFAPGELPAALPARHAKVLAGALAEDAAPVFTV